MVSLLFCHHCWPLYATLLTHKKCPELPDFVELSWIGCLTSHLTIFQSYMWRHIDVQADWRRSWDLRSGSQRHRHFVGFFNVPVLAPTRGPTFLYGDSDTPPHLVAFYDHAGDTEVHILDLTPQAGFCTVAKNFMGGLQIPLSIQISQV